MLMNKQKSTLFSTYNTSPENIIADVRVYLEKRQWSVYNSVAGLCNSVLSKNHHSSNFLLYYLENKNFQFPFYLFFKNSFLYFYNSTKTLAYEILLILLVSKNKFTFQLPSLMVISFFNFDKLEKSVFDDLYLAGLQKELAEKNIEFSFLPKLYHFPRNVFDAKKAFSDIKNINKGFVTPYEFLNFVDALSLVLLMIELFFRNILTLKIFSKEKKDQAYNLSLIENLKDSDVNKLLYYLTAKKLSKIENIKKVILWYENQVIDKCLIKGLRENDCIEIYGCQFFLSLPQQMNLYPSHFEVEKNLCPDKIFTTQPIPESSHAPLKYRQGVSLRYLYLNSYEITDKSLPKLNKAAVFLTFYENNNQQIYNLLKEAILDDFIISIKKHPANENTNIPDVQDWVEVTGKQELILLENEFVFSADSGIVFESMAMARQVIIIGSRNGVSHFVPPGKYRGKLFFLVDNASEIRLAIDSLRRFRLSNTEEFLDLVKSIRREYFNSSDKSILEVLDIV